MIPPVSALVTTTLPSGLTFSAQVTRTTILTSTVNPFSLITQTEIVSINGRPYTSIYSATARTFVDQSPTGRTVTTTIDATGRVVYEQATGLAPANYAYDSCGRLVTATFAYNSAGYLAASPTRSTVQRRLITIWPGASRIKRCRMGA
jgi:hypothetical protein